MGQTAREQGGGARSVWISHLWDNSLIWLCANITGDIFQYMHFVTDVSLNVMCSIIIKRACVLSEAYLRCSTLLWRSTGIRPLPSAFSDTTPPYGVLHKASVQVISFWPIVLHGYSGVMKHTPYGFIPPVWRLPASAVYSDSRALFIVLPLLLVESNSDT